MKSFAVLAATATMMASIVSGAPAVEKRQYTATLVFVGAAGASFTLDVPTDGSEFYINNPLSISHIYSYGGATCDLEGIDGSYTEIVGVYGADVGPPQTQVKGSCLAIEADLARR